ncbi:MAG TPA: MFS transporter [Streptosporangiaceae bacterium]|nr:MFS transporter [Streptosporangiaceae bacterium]
MTVTSQKPAQATSTAPAGLVAKWAPLAVILCGTFVFILDYFVVNVALPSIQRTLHAGPGAVEWVVAGYGLTMAAFLVCGGRLGDLHGRRRWWCIGLAVFTASSVMCAIAPNPAFLILARLAQGTGAACMAPNTLSILGVLYTGRDQVRAFSAYGIVLAVAATGGQLIGGALVNADIAGLGWRAVFWINVPIGLAALAVARRVVPESRSDHSGRLDLTGAALLTAALVAIVLPLVEGRQQGWPAWSWACLAAAPVLLGVLGWYLRGMAARGRQPLVDPAIFAVGAFRNGLIVQVLFCAAQAAGFLVLALYLQLGRGMSPLAAGSLFVVLAASYVLTSFRAPALTIKYGRRVIAIGAVLCAVGNVVLMAAVWHWGTGGPLLALIPGLVLGGAGQGLCITPLTSTIMATADARTTGSVSGALATAQQVGNAIGIAVTGVVFYDLIGHGYGVAFRWSLAEMTAVLLAMAALTLTLPKRSK